MKKTFFLATVGVLIAVLCSICSCTAVREEAPQEGLFAEELLCLVTTEDGVVTKTVNNGSATLWADSDQLTAINISDGAQSYVSGHLTYRGNNTFGGRLTYSGDVNDWYMIYPHRDDNKTPQQIHISVPESQIQTGNGNMSHIAGDGFPLVGKELGVPRSDQLSVRMRNVLARFDYKVTNTTSGPIVVKSIEFTAPIEITGDFVGDITYDNIPWKAQKGASKKVLLTVNEAESLSEGATEQFYAGVMPFTIPAGSNLKAKVTATDANGNAIVFFHQFAISSATSINAGKTYTFNMNFDANHSIDPDPDSEDPTPQDPDKEDQELAFAQATVTWQIGNGYSIGNSYDIQAVNGARTTVTYTSSNENVAKVSGTRVEIVGVGSTTITANAPANDLYNAASKYYTLVISQSTTPVPVGEAVYELVTEEPPKGWDGTYLIVDVAAGKAFAAFSGNASSYAVDVTIVDNKIVASSAINRYAFTVTDAGVAHENSNFSGQEAYNLRNSEGMYIFGSSNEVYIGSTNQKASQSSGSSTMNTYYSVFKYADGGVQVASSVQSSGAYRYYLGYNGSAFGYAGGSSVTTGDTERRVQLFRLTDGITKQNQTLSFAQNNVQWTLGSGYSVGNSYAAQSVSGAQTTVTYTSNNTNVATISGTNIVIVGAGTTTITANAAENDNYYAASKGYTLTITSSGSSSTSTERTYTYQTSVSAGTYLLGGYESSGSQYSIALFPTVLTGSWESSQGSVTNGQYIGQRDVTSSNTLTFTDDNDIFNAEVELIASGSDWKIRIKSTGQYLTVPSRDNAITYTSSESSASAFSISNGNGTSGNYMGISSGSYYFYHSGSANGFSMRAYQVTNIRLYKLTSESGSSTNKQNQSLSFASPSVTWSLDNGYSIGSSYSVQSVSGAQTSVTYSSSNTNVATVSGNQLRIVGAGTTTITANAVGNDSYNPASQSYTLTITSSGSSSSSSRTYTYQSSVSAGTYLIGGYESSGSQYSIALFPTVLTGNWESSQGSVANGQYLGQRDVDSSNTLTFNNDSEIFNAEVELIASGSNWKIKVKSTGQYLTVPTSDNRVVYTDSESSAAAFSISGGGSFGASGGEMGISSGNYYFYHSGSAHGFSMRAYQVTNIRLYKLTSESGSSSSQQNQNLSFPQSTVTVSMNSYPAGSTLSVQQVSGAQTNVTYTSSNTNVATVSGTTLTIKGAGQTTITANAVASGSYNAASKAYTLVVTEASAPGTGGATYVKASSLTVGGTYLITDVDDTRLFKGATDGSYIGISPASGVITDANNAYSGYEFTVTQSGSKYCILFNDGRYLLCDYSGNSTTGLVFESSKPSDTYLYSLTVSGERFEFMTAQRNSSSTSEILYYKPSSMGGTGADTFKIGGSGTGIGVHLYLKTSAGKKAQSVSFSQSSVTRSMETASGTLSVQTLQNAIGNVSYSSSNTGVATVSGTTITIRGFGSTTITGTAAGNDEYYSGSASYTLYVNRVSQEGVYNLENDLVFNYLNEATSLYTSANHSSTTLIKTNSGWGSTPAIVYSYNGVDYTPSASDRWDCPKPVTVTWSTALSGNKSVYVYTDAAHTQQVSYIENPVTVSNSTNSAEIFNLIPGITYYYVVRNGSSDVASGNFTTEGRRRMMKISSNFSQDHANNCRDLGGQITTSGRRIKYGKIYRGSNMDQTANTNPDEQKILKQYMKIELDVDLRGSDRKDALGFGHEIANLDDTDYRGHTNEYYNSSSDLRHSDQRMGATLARIMRAVHNNVNVYVHCMVGADRTGFTCMMLEALLGVPLERCDMDYEMTSFSVVGTRPRNGRSVSHYNDGVDAINGRLSGQSNATYQDKAIDYAVNYFGISRDLITQFQNDMLE